MKNKEYEYYEKKANWDFGNIEYEKECFTNWDLYECLKKETNETSKVLDLGTAGGEFVLEKFPKVGEVLATDFSDEMIKIANKNLSKTAIENVAFKVMDNLHMTTPDSYFDVVVARRTPIDPRQIYKTLKIRRMQRYFD